VTELMDIPLSLLDPSPFNTRVKIDPDAIVKLAESMKRRGQIESITVRPHGDRYEIVSGERRWRALEQAGIPEARCIVREMGDEEVMMVQWEENENRVGYSDYAKALKLSQIAESQRLSQRELADEIGKSVGYVNNFLQMLKLQPVFTRVNAVGLLYDMTEFQARAILRAPQALLTEVCKEVKHYHKIHGDLPSAPYIPHLIDIAIVESKSYQDVTVPMGTPGPPVSMESPPTSTEEKEAPVPLEGDVMDVTTTPDTPVTPPESPLQDYIADTYSRIPGADGSWLRDVLKIKFRLSDREARDELRRYKGRQSPSAEAEEKPEPRKARYTPPKPLAAPTTTCPLCGSRVPVADLELALQELLLSNPDIAPRLEEVFKR